MKQIIVGFKHGVVVLITGVMMSFGLVVFAQDNTDATISYEDTKRTIMQDIYNTQEYLPLIDIKQATVDLNTIKASLDRIQDQASLRVEQEEEINTRVQQLQLSIATILKDTTQTQDDIQRLLQSLAILKKKISTNEDRLVQTTQDLKKHEVTIAQYLRFLYITQNTHGMNTTDSQLIRLLLQEETIAESLSQQDFLKLLTQHISVLMQTLTTQRAGLEDLINTMRTSTQTYAQESIELKKHLTYLEQQKTSVYELMGYLQQESQAVSSQISRIQQSESQLQSTASRLETIVRQGENADTSEYQLLYDDERALDNNFFSWPFVAIPEVKTWWSSENESVRFVLEQDTPLYAPAPGVVHQVQRDESAQLAWIVLLHKEGYATFMASLSQVYVQPGDIVGRGELIASSGGKPGTRGAGVDSLQPHLDLTVMKSGKPIDPLTMLDLSVFESSVILGRYQKDYIQDQGIRQVYLNSLDRMSGETIRERVSEFLRIYARAPFNDPALWYQGSQDTGINPVLGVCIGFAETSFKNFKTPNNIGNVGNDDRGRTVTFSSPRAGVLALFNVFNNQYLRTYTQLNQLSRFGNDDGFIYASSSYNRQKNIMNCLTSIYGYRVPEDVQFRVPVED